MYATCYSVNKKCNQAEAGSYDRSIFDRAQIWKTVHAAQKTGIESVKGVNETCFIPITIAASIESHGEGDNEMKSNTVFAAVRAGEHEILADFQTSSGRLIVAAAAEIAVDGSWANSANSRHVTNWAPSFCEVVKRATDAA
ncbi:MULTISPECIES: hypothetical protein [Paraburkholderia]|uniref:Uncharacterized protein n=1 Tax=Paraburkholderia podalyriae TaxID=1938811 RepID=A0ABR7PXV7_9BURK|nr:hypothetical protein [Paraburkholderia podalyriae]MBC8751024.1 hypothetical protein [Paraburkholderia podalyriae]